MYLFLRSVINIIMIVNLVHHDTCLIERKKNKKTEDLEQDKRHVLTYVLSVDSMIKTSESCYLNLPDTFRTFMISD